MLVGQQMRGKEEAKLSDTMILCTVNKQTKTLTLTSFLRDAYVKLPNYKNHICGMQRINVAYNLGWRWAGDLGGMEMLDATLKENFGVQIDANVEVDFNGFMKLIDMVGGVEIELTQEEAGFMNRNGNWGVESNQGWNLKAGKNKLNGSQALAYSRIRYIGTDFARTERQRKVITSLLEAAKGMSVLEMNKLLNEAVTLVTTDMTNSDITNYALELLPLIADLTINTQRIPLDNTYSFKLIEGVGDSIIMDFETNRKFLQETLAE
jgi:LCP family protein required for cell wall assembly